MPLSYDTDQTMQIANIVLYKKITYIRKHHIVGKEECIIYKIPLSVKKGISSLF